MHVLKKGVGIGVEKTTHLVGHVLPEKRRAEMENRVQELQKKGFLPSTVTPVDDDEKPTPDPFPDLKSFPLEPAVKRWYNWDNKKWETCKVNVKIHPERFAEGGMRAAHFMVLIKDDGKEERMVAKRQKDGAQNADIYDTDVLMQAACQAIAKAFNDRKPIKQVQFIDCFVIQRKDGNWWGVETYLKGKYIKYNNNYGYVGKDARNTPQAFTHFSFEFTEKKMMIVDIQGVGDHYTDPQIHTADGKGYGLGNMGLAGMDRFLKSHRCNPICIYLGLPIQMPKKFGVRMHHNPKSSGTVAAGSHLHEDLENMNLGDFLGDIQPKKGSASPEDLALLGLTEKQFNSLVTAFNELDKDKSGALDKEELYHLFQKAKVAETKTKEMEEFVAFVSRIESQVNAQGKISFKAFLLCWTDNL